MTIEEKDHENEISRRDFLQGSAGLLGGLIVAFYVPTVAKMGLAAAAEGSKNFPPNAFIQIAPDSSITIVINKLEMGQGVNTSLAQLISEELECDWKTVQSVSCRVDPIYNTVGMPMIMTGGSNALNTTWDQYRKIGASMREMLKQAAAKRWGVPVSEVKAENGFILHPQKGKLPYGELAEDANRLPLPENPPLKSSKDYKIIGKSTKRVDALPKANGTAIFGIDVRIPNMLYASVAKPHLEIGKLVSYDEKAAKAVKGVVDVVKFGDRIAVLATNTYSARKGQKALNAKWDLGRFSKASTDEFMEEFKKTGEGRGLPVRSDGDVDAAMKKAKSTFTAQYEFPFLAHAPMEPMNCTINFDGKTAELWSGHQMPTGDQQVAAKILGIPEDKINIHITYAGGSFGRRASKSSDYVAEACELARIVKRPLKVVWSREDDMHGGFYRPMTHHRVTLGFDEKNQLLAWDHHIVGQSILEGSPFAAFMIKNGIEETVIEGVDDTKYTIPNFRLDQTRPTTPVTTLWWRSVGHTHSGYVMETMIDELAVKTGKDPLELRRTLLKKSPKHLAVLDLLKKETNWGKAKPPKGRAWGLAVHESFKSVVGHVVEVSIEKDGLPKVHKVWSAVHVGQVVNPEGAATQVEGAIIFALSAFLHQHIEFKDGQIQQSNFDDYPVLRMKDMPQVSVHFVKSDEHPTGLGEPGVPPLGPAVANAIYRLTNKRIRALPYIKGMKV